MKNNCLIAGVCSFILCACILSTNAQSTGPVFLECEPEPVSLCTTVEGVRLPENNKIYLGEGHPDATSCSVHISQKTRVKSTCGTVLNYEVQIILFDTSAPHILQPLTSISVDSLGEAVLLYDSELALDSLIKGNGIPYTTGCERYHRIKWIVSDSCGQMNECHTFIDVYDCNEPLISSSLYVIRSDAWGFVHFSIDTFQKVLVDDCTNEDQILISLIKSEHQPDTFFHICDVPAFGVELPWTVWMADKGRDDNCNGSIEWNERGLWQTEFNLVFVDNFNSCPDTIDPYVAGEIRTEDMQTVEKVQIELVKNGIVADSQITAGDGKYLFLVFPNPPFTIEPKRNDNHKNGVSTLDLIMIRKFILDAHELNPYDIIAADANNSQSVSVGDILTLRKLILGITPTLPNNTSWRFIPENFILVNSQHPWPFPEALEYDPSISGDFIAVKVGDVNNTVQANFNSILPRNPFPQILWSVKSKKFSENEIVDIELSIKSEINLQGFQFTISCAGLEFIDATSKAIKLSEENYALFDDRITFSWFDEEGITLSVNDIVLTLRAKAKHNGSLQNLSINSEITEAEVYSMKDEIFIPQLNITQLNEESKSFIPFPNPWKEFTTISFGLRNDGEVTIEFFNLDGRSIYRKQGSFYSGENFIKLHSTELPERGMLIYKATSSEFNFSGKCLLLD